MWAHPYLAVNVRMFLILSSHGTVAIGKSRKASARRATSAENWGSPRVAAPFPHSCEGERATIGQSIS